MKPRLIAWALWIAFVIVLIAAAIYGLNPPSGDPIRLIDVLWALSFIGFPTTGALIASRMPKRPLGWIFCTAPLFTMVAVLFGDVATRSDLSPTAADWLAWTSNILFSLGLALLLFTPLLLPSGSPETRFDRIVARVMVVCAIVWAFSAAFTPGSLMEIDGFRNPIGIDALDGFFEILTSAMFPAIFAAFLASIGSLVVRYHRSSGQQRLQLKWVAVAAASIPISFAIVFLIERFEDLGDLPVTLVFMFAVMVIPTSIGTAMLKHRLYEIDQVINRALVYSIVTALLIGAYLGSVVALRTIFDPVTPDSDLAVAASTLAVAAIFRPLRGRIQGFIDRRFYRRKYDAARTLERFGSRLRAEVDLDLVQRDVLTVLSDTVQPAHVGLWLKRSEA